MSDSFHFIYLCETRDHACDLLYLSVFFNMICQEPECMCPNRYYCYSSVTKPGTEPEVPNMGKIWEYFRCCNYCWNATTVPVLVKYYTIFVQFSLKHFILILYTKILKKILIWNIWFCYVKLSHLSSFMKGLLSSACWPGVPFSCIRRPE